MADLAERYRREHVALNCKPDWDRHGRAAPFRRNDDLLNLLPKGVIAFPGSGITDNLVDKAVQLGIPVLPSTPEVARFSHPTHLRCPQ